MHGRFVVPKSGFYYIYSQITFIEQQPAADDVTLSHSVHRQNGEFKEKLLESVRSKCKLQTGSSNSSNYVGAVFFVNKGDGILVKSSHAEMIYYSPNANFFGMHMI